MSQTPILDRLAPLPAQARSRRGMTVVIVVWSFVLATLAAAVALGHPPMLREWLLVTMPKWVESQGAGTAIGLLAISTFVSSLGVVVVHEGGHILAGITAGFRFKSIRLGPLKFDRVGGLSFLRDLVNPFAGVATVVPTTTERLVPRGIAMLAGGPGANILSGCLVLLLPFSHGFLSWLFIVQSIGNGLSDLLPYRSKLGVSDGTFLWALVRDRSRAERWLALMRLSSDSMEGVLPELLPVDFINKAVAPRDDSIDTVVSHVFAFSSAFHQHQNCEAGRFLETCLLHAGHAPASMREALMSEAAVFQARRRKRTDLAEQWLADIPPTTGLRWLRPRAEAAILEAKGDVRGEHWPNWRNANRPFMSSRTLSDRTSCDCWAGGSLN
ncbi:MAG: hypothetical protein EHM23_21530 [Acidobacteria bacterium]|nr:MAG: hypothetical protein EHM23_21530 [Acidobacteriota bacterium]